MGCFDIGKKFQFLRGFEKKTVIAPTLTFTVEVFFITTIALGILVYFHGGIGRRFRTDLFTSLLLAFLDPLTAALLILFSYAVCSVILST